MAEDFVDSTIERLHAERDAARADAEQAWALAARLHQTMALLYDSPARFAACRDYEAALAARKAR